MTATNHAVTGALVAVVINRPLLAIPIAFLTHFIMDALPHFGLNIKDVNQRNSSKIFRFVLVGDILISSFMLVLIPILLSPVYSWWVVLLCMLACMSPDLVWGWHFYFELKTKKQRFKSWFSRWHAKIQWSESLPGALVELAWFVVVFNLITDHI